MAATQTRIRRGTSSQIEAMTPAADEVISDETYRRLRLGDGVTSGGIIIPNYMDTLNNRIISASVSGTANDITLSVSVPVNSYENMMEVKFMAVSSNNGNVTVDVNGLGQRPLRKISGGSVVELSPADISAGGIYSIIYDGSQFQLTVLTESGLISVGQGDLRTSSGTISISPAQTSNNYFVIGDPQSPLSSSYVTRIQTIRFSGSTLGATGTSTLPGGQYGFYPQIRSSGSVRYALQRYITSSPPYNLGDGNVGGFFFAVVSKSGDIKQTYIADTPPWAYNGPTDIRCTHKCPVTGKKFKKVVKQSSLEDVINRKRIDYKMVEIDDSIKNADMGIIPHPFGEIDDGDTIVLVDPMCDKVRSIIDYQNAGGHDEVSDYISNGKIEIDNTKVKRCCPNGVSVHKMKFKYSKK